MRQQWTSRPEGVVPVFRSELLQPSKMSHQVRFWHAPLARARYSARHQMHSKCLRAAKALKEATSPKDAPPDPEDWGSQGSHSYKLELRMQYLHIFAYTCGV